MKKFFYHQGRVSTLLQQGVRTHLLASPAGIMAVYENLDCHLVASEASESPTSFISPQERDAVVFSAYGSSPEKKLTVGFKGELQDSTTRHYLLGNGYRAYNPALMRFNSPDRESPFARGGINTYTFVLNDPINGRDPSGRFGEFFSSMLSRVFTKKTYRGPIVAEFEGVVAFTAPPRQDGRLPTLYITSHGAAGFIGGNNAAIHDGLSLYKKLIANKVDMTGRQTHLLSCDSSLPNSRTGRSMTQEMSSMTGAQSSGYAATVSLVETRLGNEYQVQKLRVMPFHGMTSTKTRSGGIRDPQWHLDDDYV